MMFILFWCNEHIIFYQRYMATFVRDTPLANIEGHEKRVSRVAYHPSGRFLASCWWVKEKICLNQKFQLKTHWRWLRKICERSCDKYSTSKSNSIWRDHVLCDSFNVCIHCSCRLGVVFHNARNFHEGKKIITVHNISYFNKIACNLAN